MTTQQEPRVDLDKIVDRIKKLNAKAESCKAIGSYEEAEAFATAVQKMLLKYKLEMSALADDVQDKEEPMGVEWLVWAQHGLDSKGRRQGWVERLVAAVCSAHFCKMIVTTGSNTLIVVGRATDKQAAAFVSTTLVRTAIDLADKAYRKERYRCWKAGKMDEAHGYREAFLFGFVTRIRERYAAMKIEEEQQYGQRYAMIVVKSDEALVKYMKDELKTKKASGTKMEASNGNGVRDGRAAADRASLRANGVGAGDTATARKVGPAPRALGSGN